MTFLQQTLGKNYKWWYLTHYEFKKSSSQFKAFLLNNSVLTIEFLAIVFIWRINSPSADIITYLAIGRIFTRLMSTWIDGHLSILIMKGGLTNFLIVPSNVFARIFFSDLGFNFFRSFITTLIILLFANLVFSGYLIFSYSLVYLIPLFIIAFLIRTFLNFSFGSITFWNNDLANATSILNSFKTAGGLMSGNTIPLFVIFSGFYNPIFWTPFAFLLHHPMQIYLGKYNQTEIIQTFVGGIIWCITLWILARLIFKVGLKKNEAIGL